MNSEQYKELKEMVISMSNTTILNLFEILIDEINYRKLKKEGEEKWTKKDTKKRKTRLCK